MNELDAALNRIRGDGDDLTLIRRELDRLRAELARRPVALEMRACDEGYKCSLHIGSDAVTPTGTGKTKSEAFVYAMKAAASWMPEYIWPEVESL